MINIVSFQDTKDLTGFEFSYPVIIDADISGNYKTIPRTVQAVRLKVDKLTRIDLFLNNFLAIKESSLIEQDISISRFKGDCKAVVYIGDDTLFETVTEITENDDYDSELSTAGFSKLASYSFNESEESNMINISQEYHRRSIAVDLDTIKTELSISTSEVCLVIVFIVSGNIIFLNVSRPSGLQAIFNFNMRGSRFFFFRAH